MAGFGLSQILRLGANVVVAALLFEEAFAVMAIVNAVIQGLAMFSDIGLGPSVVRNPRGDERNFLNTVWTIQIVRGAVLAIVATVLAWPVAAFYEANDPFAGELRGLLPLAGLATLIAGFNSTKLLTASRHLNLARATIVDLVAQTVGLAAMLIGAWLTKSVYSLVLGSLISALIVCIASHIALPGPSNGFRWDRAAAREIIRLGQWVFLSTALTFLAVQIDRLAFAKLFPLDLVGVYAIAATLARLVPNLIGRLQTSVAFPVLSQIVNESAETFGKQFERVKFATLIVAAYTVAILIACSEPFVDLLYDERYAAAGKYMAILGAGAFFACAEQLYAIAYLAHGRSNVMALTSAAKTIGFIALLFPVSHYWGFTGAIFVVTASEAIKALLSVAFRKSIGAQSLRIDTLLLLLCLASGYGSWWLGHLMADRFALGSGTLLIVQGVLVSLMFAPMAPRAIKALKR